MNRAFANSAVLILSTVALAGCSTVQDALDYGRGPFDQSPATGSEAALEGLHESSWGNSGKWGAQPDLEDPLDDKAPEPDKNAEPAPDPPRGA